MTSAIESRTAETSGQIAPVVRLPLRSRLWNWLRGYDPARDLTEIWSGPLTIEIVGVGEQRLEVREREQLAGLIAFVFVMTSGRMAIVSDTSRAPWRVVSFDRTEPRIKVQPI